ncbi:ATP-binding cassette domain-containing protein, partial [Burkholderia pseudomallei]|uniref:ATP-binding cassette domain-containing protein n=1 Tax=Burkholderia pseudomallei TaxID=28450 RepID=UPI001329A937
SSGGCNAAWHWSGAGKPQRAGGDSQPEHSRKHLSVPPEKCVLPVRHSYHQQDKRLAEEYRTKLKIKLGSVEHPVSSLSGGNQQKVVIAKWLNTGCDVLILDEPTRGVDVGAKVEIYNVIHELAERGYALILISSEVAAVIHLSHRAYAMSGGSFTRALTAYEISDATVMKHAIPKRALV